LYGFSQETDLFVFPGTRRQCPARHSTLSRKLKIEMVTPPNQDNPFYTNTDGHHGYSILQGVHGRGL